MTRLLCLLLALALLVCPAEARHPHGAASCGPADGCSGAPSAGPATVQIPALFTSGYAETACQIVNTGWVNSSSQVCSGGVGTGYPNPPSWHLPGVGYPVGPRVSSWTNPLDSPPTGCVVHNVSTGWPSPSSLSLLYCAGSASALNIVAYDFSGTTGTHLQPGGIPFVIVGSQTGSCTITDNIFGSAANAWIIPYLGLNNDILGCSSVNISYNKVDGGALSYYIGYQMGTYFNVTQPNIPVTMTYNYFGDMPPRVISIAANSGVCNVNLTFNYNFIEGYGYSNQPNSPHGDPTFVGCNTTTASTQTVTWNYDLVLENGPRGGTFATGNYVPENMNGTYTAISLAPTLIGSALLSNPKANQFQATLAAGILTITSFTNPLNNANWSVGTGEGVYVNGVGQLGKINTYGPPTGFEGIYPGLLFNGSAGTIFAGSNGHPDTFCGTTSGACVKGAITIANSGGNNFNLAGNVLTVFTGDPSIALIAGEQITDTATGFGLVTAAMNVTLPAFNCTGCASIGMRGTYNFSNTTASYATPTTMTDIWCSGCAATFYDGRIGDGVTTGIINLDTVGNWTDPSGDFYCASTGLIVSVTAWSQNQNAWDPPGTYILQPASSSNPTCTSSFTQ